MKRSIFLISIILVFGCASRVVKLEQYSMSMNLKVAADSSVTIGDDENIHGVLWLNPILKMEGVNADKVRLIQNYGRYFVCADNFKHVWMVEPKGDGLSASYTAIDATPADKADAYNEISLSRYGSRENACVRFRFNGKEVFIDKKGGVNEKCEK
ncbi:hypothetical protein A2V82_06845 [candidate division KSB1 bacterium RBG_16_48_16]|nr:MAG: hypothetical protein A2V82_06845 [candidate division KSB1 bacterium RBG_16_48_16]